MSKNSAEYKWTHLRMLSSFATKEAFVKFASRSAAPGIVAHDVAPDASIEFLASLGFNPNWGEEIVNLAVDLMAVGYSIGSAHANERYADDFESIVADCDYLQQELTKARKELDRENATRRSLQVQNARMREKLLKIENIILG